MQRIMEIVATGRVSEVKRAAKSFGIALSKCKRSETTPNEVACQTPCTSRLKVFRWFDHNNFQHGPGTVVQVKDMSCTPLGREYTKLSNKLNTGRLTYEDSKRLRNIISELNKY